MPCITCNSKHSTKYTIHLKAKNEFGTKGFKAEVAHCERCMQGWHEHVVALTGQLPDGTWKKY